MGRKGTTYADSLVFEASGESLSNRLLVLFLNDAWRCGEDTICSLSFSDIGSDTQLEEHT